MATKVTHIFKDAAIDGAIVGVAGDAKTLQQRIHNLAVSICMVWSDQSAPSKISEEDAFAAANAACVRLTNLQKASPYHAVSFSKWVEVTFPFMKWAEETETYYVHADNARLGGKAFQTLRDGPTFWEVKPATKPTPFNDLEKLETLMVAAMKRPKAKKTHEDDVIHMDMWKQIQTIMRETKAADAKRQHDAQQEAATA